MAISLFLPHMLITSNGEKGYTLPDFVIPGAAKSGTTTLYNLLDQHPAIFFPRDRKEPFYFGFDGEMPAYTDPDFARNLLWQTDAYLSLYTQAAPGQRCGDASTSYLYLAPKAIAHMQRMYGNRFSEVRVYILLRNPVERAYSHYTYLVRNGHENLSFAEAIHPDTIARRRMQRWGFDYLEYGMYHQQVKAFMEAFPHTRVFLTDDLKRPQELCNTIFTDLGLEPVAVKKDLKSNPSGIPKNRMLVNLLRNNPLLRWAGSLAPSGMKRSLKGRRDKALEALLEKKELDRALRLQLVEYYRADVQALAALIQRDLSHWTP